MLQQTQGQRPNRIVNQANRCQPSVRRGLAVLGTVLASAMWHPAAAATLCVNPGGTSGCYSKIGSAVAAASPHDTVKVAPGTYREDVVIGKALSLYGTNSTNTIIDASGLSNGVYIDGLDNPGLRDVLVTGFTVRNANFEGVLITNASASVVYSNRVTGNNKGLNLSSFTCPGLPSFETSEDEDCGEGIHLVGADHSIISSNIVQSNAGGILMSDETAATQNNLITANIVSSNPYDCGITLASHPPAMGSAPFGVVHNTIAGNTSSHNGYQVPGAGAGIGIFTFLAGGTVSGNVVINNTITNNGLPGVTFHAHSPGEDLSDNMIVGNNISGNAADTEDAATPGPTGINIFGVSAITGTIVSQNVIDDEQYAVVVNTPTEVEVHLNDLLDAQFGLDNLGTNSVSATENWWGCPGGPNTTGCGGSSGVGVYFAPWLTAPF